MSKYPSKIQEQVEMLSMFSDRADRIDALVDLGSHYEAARVADIPRTVERRVPGCESEVYVDAQPQGDGLKVRFAIDNPQGISAMAMARILEEGLEGEPVTVLASLLDDLVYEVFGRELSMGKSMGLIGMVRMVKVQAAQILSAS